MNAPDFDPASLPRRAAGSTSVYFVEILDANLRITYRVPGYAETITEALAFLRRSRRRYPDAVLVHELLLREVIA